MGFRHPAIWIVLILLIIVLFGASKLPDITRNLGKSLKIFKEEVRDLREDTDVSTPPVVDQNPSPTDQQSQETQGDPGQSQAGSSQPPQAPDPNSPTDPR